jgi:hypothetical protein
MPDTYEDDPTIPNEERLLRWIPCNWVLWDENGAPSISSAAFKDQELSVSFESVIISAGRQASDAMRPNPGSALAAITAGHARALEQKVARDPTPEEPAHGIVYGRKKNRGIGGKLRDGASWVVKPTRP